MIVALEDGLERLYLGEREAVESCACYYVPIERMLEICWVDGRVCCSIGRRDVDVATG
jgi:hypothetical protein